VSGDEGMCGVSSMEVKANVNIKTLYVCQTGLAGGGWARKEHGKKRGSSQLTPRLEEQGLLRCINDGIRSC